MFLTRYCLKNPVAVTLFFLAICVIGLTALMRMGRSTLPPVSTPAITITAPYPGAAPPEMERLIVEPLEEQLNGLPDVSRVSASAQNGLAEVVAQFRFGSSIDVDAANVQQAVNAARTNMPADLVPPLVSKDDPGQAPVLEEAVSSVLVSNAELSDALARQITPALRQTAGIGNVRVSGAQTRQFTVRPKDGALAALQATPLDIYRAVAAGNDVFPGGYLRTPIVQTPIGIDAAAVSAQALEELPVSIAGKHAVSLSDVATVEDGYADASTTSRVDGQPAVIISVSRAAGEDTLHAIANARATFRRLGARLPQIRFEELRTDAPATKANVNGILQTLGEGVVLTVLVMLLFLHAWRNALIAAIAIPTSLCAAFAAMWVCGFTLNVLSLMGLSLTIGLLVDDSIVIIEAITRHAHAGASGDEAALQGRRELGGAAFAITLVDVAVFAPIGLMSGLVGEFMREFGLVVVFATAFSLLVSLTLTPVLAARFALRAQFERLDGLSLAGVFAGLRERSRSFPWTFRKGPLLAMLAWWHGALNAFNRFEESLARRYAYAWLPWTWKHRSIIAGSAFAACALSLGTLVAGAIPAEFSPPVNRGETTVDLRFPAGTPLVRTDAALSKVANALLDDPSIEHIEATAGRSFSGSSDVFASNVGELAVILADPTSNGSGIVDKVKALNYLAPAASIAGAGKGMGGAAPISYSVSGDARAIDAAAGRIVRLLRENPYATDIRTSDAGVAPYMLMRVDDDRARLLNISPDDAAQTARIATAGAIAAKARLPSGLIDVVIQSPGAQPARQVVRSSDGQLVPLSDVTNLETLLQPVVIEREDGQRIVTVSANPVDGAPISAVTSALTRQLSDPNALPPGTHIEPRGDIEQFLETVWRIVAALAISLLFVYVILAVLYRSYVLPLIIMLTVPLASVGAFGSLFVLNALKNVFPGAQILQFQTLNLYSMLGIVMLVGLVAKNGILLIEFAERAVRSGQSAFEAIRSAAHRRFRPILMTTLAMIAGMLPLALGHTVGAEYRRALGTVVIGGLSTSLLLTLFIVPIVYVAYRELTGSRSGRRENVMNEPSQIDGLGPRAVSFRHRAPSAALGVFTRPRRS